MFSRAFSLVSLAAIATACTLATRMPTAQVPAAAGGEPRGATGAEASRFEPPAQADPDASTTERPQTATLEIRWPGRRTTQAIPLKTATLQLAAYGPDGALVATASAQRPATAATSSITVPAEADRVLPLGENRIDASALDPSGSVLATGSAKVTVILNRAVDATLTIGRAWRYLFDVAAPSGNLGGISGADGLCAAGKPPAVAAAKAVITDGASRLACTTANCGGGVTENKDWVLAPSTQYRRGDDKVVGTTTAAGIFAFPLTSTLTASESEWWSGMGTNWVADGTTHCNSWTSDAFSSAITAGVGETDRTDATALRVFPQSCNRTNVVLMCAEQ